MGDYSNDDGETSVISFFAGLNHSNQYLSRVIPKIINNH